MKSRYLSILLALSGLMPSLGYGQIPAFPGAEGPGANASGGRGGDVYHVTNLEFDKDGLIPGSFKYGINTAPAAGRTIVFDVGGTIFQNGGGSGWWFRSGKSNITVAGQTAPGPGVTIAGVATKFTGDNVVLRNITVRPGKDPVNPTSFTYDAFSLQLTNSVVDHVTASWFTDEGISQTDAGANSTIQYSLINEGLNYNGHSYGSIIATEVDGAQASYHHNLYAHNNSRMPRLGSVTGATGAVTNMANNVFYNWVNRAGYSGTDQNSSTNFLNNYYIKGNNNGQTIFTGGDDATPTGTTKIYENGGNKRDLDKDGTFDGTMFNRTSGSPTAFAGTQVFVNQAFAVAGTSTLETADVALQRVLDYGGANWANRNPIDERIVQSVRTGTGSVINDLTTGVQATEWSTVLSQVASGGVAPFTRASNWDTDQDGMPDHWEQHLGLDANVANNNGDFDNDGYTDLEEYLNEISAWPAATPIEFKNDLANGRFANIQNWEVEGQQVNIAGQGMVTPTSYWQPSKFDSAVINNGTVVVDAVGQHAGNVILAMNAGDNATLNITSGWLKVEDAPYGISDGATVIGDHNSATAVLNLSGGKLTTKTLLKGADGSFNFTGGVLSAETVGFTLVNNGGTIAPGNSPGVTHVMGDLTMNSGAIEIEIAGSGANEYDVVWVDGTLAAGGSLNVLLDDYSPVEGDLFEIFSFSLSTGDFDLNLPALANGLAWDSSELLITGTLSVVAGVAQDGDFDGDGDVDGRDFLMWQRGKTNDPHSPTELEQWQNGYNGGQLAASTAVPEPSSLMLVIGLLIGGICRSGGLVSGR